MINEEQKEIRFLNMQDDDLGKIQDRAKLSAMCSQF